MKENNLKDFDWKKEEMRKIIKIYMKEISI